MKQRIFKMDNEQDIKDLFNLLPDSVNWIAKFESGGIVGLEQEPIENTVCAGLRIDKVFDIEFKGNNIIQRPFNYEDWIGKWGIFADKEEDLVFAGSVVSRLSQIERYCGSEDDLFISYFITSHFSKYKKFRLLTPEEKQQIMEN